MKKTYHERKDDLNRAVRKAGKLRAERLARDEERKARKEALND